MNAKIDAEGTEQTFKMWTDEGETAVFISGLQKTTKACFLKTIKILLPGKFFSYNADYWIFDSRDFEDEADATEHLTISEFAARERAVILSLLAGSGETLDAKGTVIPE